MTLRPAVGQLRRKEMQPKVGILSGTVSATMSPPLMEHPPWNV